MQGTEYQSTKVKLDFRERINFAVSEFGYNSIYIWISAFMAIFFTDYIGVAATSVSLLMLGVRIFDAINDPIIGSLADRTHSKWGRYRPWVAIGGTVMSLLIILLFAAQPAWPMSVKVGWMWVIYILITVASTACNMPYGALNGVITSDTEERTKLAGVRMVFANIGSNFTNLIAATLILLLSGTNRTANSARGYSLAVIVSVVIGLPTIIWSAVKSKERVQPPPEQMKKGARIPLSQQMKCLFGNKYALICLFGQFMVGFLAYGRMTIMAYYFTYYAGNFELYSVTGIVGIATGIIGSGFVWQFRHKGYALAIGFGLSGLFYIPIFWFIPQQIVFWVFYAFSNLFQTAASALRYSCDGDNADFAEYKYGIRVDGFLSAFISLMLKAGGAVGPAILIAWLDALGYVPNITQNASVLTALNLSMSIIPAILCVICAIGYLLVYDMDSKKHSEIVNELEKRRGIT